MRLILAALFVIGSVFVALTFMMGIGLDKYHPLVMGLALSAFFFLSIIASYYLFNPYWVNPLVLTDPDEVMRRLKEDGLLATTDFQARRAFGVQEYEDEGLHYFLELSDGRVLFLSGQYLYEYEPCEDDPENREPRRFPCTDFTILRHKVEGHVMELICRGTVLEPEFIALPFPKQQAWSEDIPEDGEIISDRTYDQIKALFVAGTAKSPPMQTKGK